MSTNQHQAVFRHFFAEQDRLRGGPNPDLCTPDYTAHLPGSAPLDLGGHQAFAAAFYAGFADLRHEIEQTVADGDRAAIRFCLHGTHTGEFLGIAPTGQAITVAATAILRVEDGKVAELWSEFDQLGLLRQLGKPDERSRQVHANGI